MSVVQLVRHGEVAEVILSRPEKHNAVIPETLTELIRIGKALRRDRDLRAVIIRGDGPSFCSGLDIPSFMREPRHILRHFLRPLWRSTNNFQEVAWVWRRLPVPVIAVLHGRCYGAGMQLALAADFRLATPDCELSVMEARWGLIPDMSGTVSLRELMPMDQAKWLAMTAEVFDARRGQTLGLITATHADPLAAAHAMAATLCERSPDSVAATKFLLQRTWTASEFKAFLLERCYQLPLLFGGNQRIAVKRVQGDAKPPFLPRRVQR